MVEAHTLIDGSDLTISECLSEDAGAVVDHMALLAAERGIRPRRDTDLGAAIAREVEAIRSAQATGHLMAKGEIDDELISLGRLNRGVQPSDRHVGTLELSVDEPYRELGIGRLMMLAIVDWAQDQGISKLQTTAASDNAAAIRLCEQLGFDLEGRLRRAHRSNGELCDLLCYGLWLEDEDENHNEPPAPAGPAPVAET